MFLKIVALTPAAIGEISKISSGAEALQCWLGARKPQVVIALGSGLGGLADSLIDPIELPFNEVSDFPHKELTIAGQDGMFRCGRLKHESGVEIEVLAVCGRWHMYEGFSAVEVARPWRAMRLLGLQNFLLTNATGSIWGFIKPGDLVLQEDFYACFEQASPFFDGPHLPQFGELFPAMQPLADAELKEVLLKAAKIKKFYCGDELANAGRAVAGSSVSHIHIKGGDTFNVYVPPHYSSEAVNPLFTLHNTTLQQIERDGSRRYDGLLWTGGVYAMRAGRKYETPADVHFHRVMGHTNVAMSLVPEWQALIHRYHDVSEKPVDALPPARVLALSIVANPAASTTHTPTHAEVTRAVATATPRFNALVLEWLFQLAERRLVEFTVE